MIWLFLGAFAWAQEEPSAAEEVVVYGDMLIEEAREKIVGDLEALGYDRVKTRGDLLILKHEDTWRGKVVLHPDGWLEVRRQGVRVEAPETQLKEASWLLCAIQPTACFRVGGVVVGHRKFAQQQDRAVRAVAQDVETLGDRIADRALERTLEGLPERLELLWTEGVPLEEGAEPSLTFADRKQALLSYWDSRTASVWGERVQGVVEGFLRGVVQRSEHPLTAEELEAFDLRRHHPRALPVDPP